MWELICHHTYKLEGLPVDLSNYNQHGKARNTAFLPDGTEPGSGALRFQGDAIVNIPLSPAWRTLRGVQIEVTARLNSPSLPQPRVLISGDHSFGFMIYNHDVLDFHYETMHPSTPGASSERITATTHSTVNPPYRIPHDQWIKFGVIHNGLDTMELYADGQVIARKTGLLSGVPGVRGSGVFIGMVIDLSDTRFIDIDEVKVWRLDPNEKVRVFCSRPIDEATAGCWVRYLRGINDRLAATPECDEMVAGALLELVDRLLRDIGARSPAARKLHDEVASEYARLWLAGQLDSPEMNQLVTNWCKWMQDNGIYVGDTAGLQEVLDKCLKGGAGESDLLECDRQVLALIESLSSAC